MLCLATGLVPWCFLKFLHFFLSPTCLKYAPQQYNLCQQYAFFNSLVRNFPSLLTVFMCWLVSLISFFMSCPAALGFADTANHRQQTELICDMWHLSAGYIKSVTLFNEALWNLSLQAVHSTDCCGKAHRHILLLLRYGTPTHTDLLLRYGTPTHTDCYCCGTAHRQILLLLRYGTPTHTVTAAVWHTDTYWLLLLRYWIPKHTVTAAVWHTKT